MGVIFRWGIAGGPGGVRTALPAAFCQRRGAKSSLLGGDCFSLNSSEAEHRFIGLLAVQVSLSVK